jgi:hypothetical protein
METGCSKAAINQVEQRPAVKLFGLTEEQRKRLSIWEWHSGTPARPSAFFLGLIARNAQGATDPVVSVRQPSAAGFVNNRSEVAARLACVQVGR